MNDIGKETPATDQVAMSGEGSTPSPALAYDQYLGPAMFVPWAYLLLDIATPQTGERALDLACGTGIVTRRLAAMIGDAGEVVGLDISPDMLAVARSCPIDDRSAPIDWRVGDATAISAGDDSFNLLVCQQGFQFFPDKPAAAGEMKRVLADGGRAAVAVWEGLDRHPVFRALFEAEARHLGIDVTELAVPFSLTDADELRRLFEEAGFSRVEVMTHSLTVRFTDPDRFIDLVVRSGAAVIPQLDQQSPEAHEALLASVKREAETVVNRYRNERVLEFPMYSNIVMARV